MLGLILVYALTVMLFIMAFALYVLIEIERYKEANHAEDLP